MIDFRLLKGERGDGHIVVVIKVNGEDICNVPNAERGRKTIYPFNVIKPVID